MLNLVKSAGWLVLGCLFLVTCSDDDTPVGGGPADTTPPSVESVTPVDTYHINVVFNETLARSAAEYEGNYRLVELAPTARASAAAPGDSLYLTSAVLDTDDRSVLLTSDSPMDGHNFVLTVRGVADASGNTIKTASQTAFISSADADVTPPHVVRRTPAPGATGLSVGTIVVMQFSEPVIYSNVEESTVWTNASGPVDFTIYSTYTRTELHPNDLLAYHQAQTISLSGLTDLWGNVMTDTQWAFTTTGNVDNVAPTVVSISPANLATQVDVNAAIVVTFSEPMNTLSVFAHIAPERCCFGGEWSDDGRTLTAHYFEPMLDNQQYVVTLELGYARDAAGNPLEKFVSSVFTTGSQLASGSIAGAITGDPGTAAADPTGAAVVADGDSLVGYSVVATNHGYSVQHLVDYAYQVVAVKETSGDKIYNAFTGDAIGAYGVNLDNNDTDPASVVVASGDHVTGIGFPIYDSSAILGTVDYNGQFQDSEWSMYVGLFTPDQFDPVNPGYPIAADYASWAAPHYWGLNSIYHQFPDGDYYVGAFLDLGDDGFYPGVDPLGWYGGANNPTQVHIENGNDIFDVVILMQDAAAMAAPTGSATAWRATRHNRTFERMCKVVSESELNRGKPGKFPIGPGAPHLKR